MKDRLAGGHLPCDASQPPLRGTDRPKGTYLNIDREAKLTGIFQAYAGRVYGYARRRAPAEDAQEVVAETFLVTWRRLDDVPAEPLPWLLNVARKVLANRRRASRRLNAFTGRMAAEATGVD